MTHDLGDDLIVVVRKKPKNPVWLKSYQDRFRNATRQASAETVHLHGAQRVTAMNEIVKRLLSPEENGS